MVQRKKCRSRQELSNENLLAKFGFDTAENGLPASQPKTRLIKFARSPCTDPSGAISTAFPTTCASSSTINSVGTEDVQMIAMWQSPVFDVFSKFM